MTQKRMKDFGAPLQENFNSDEQNHGKQSGSKTFIHEHGYKEHFLVA
jgi:hypothetical protein